MTACVRLIETFTLLENILLCLPLEQILTAQKVNKTFKATIDKSTYLQQALFMAQRPTQAHGKPVIPELNPLLPFPEGRSFGTFWISPPHCITPANIIRFPPLKRRDMAGGSAEDMLLRIHAVDGPRSTFRKRVRDTRMEYAGASWRRMLVMNPPCRMQVTTYGTSHHENGRDVGGVTFGDLIEAAEQEAREHREQDRKKQGM